MLERKKPNTWDSRVQTILSGIINNNNNNNNKNIKIDQYAFKRMDNFKNLGTG